MCVPCVLQVSRAFTFKQQCQRSDQTLRSYLGQIEPENDFGDEYKHIDSNSVVNITDGHRNVIKVENSEVNQLKEHNNQFDEIDDTSTDHHLHNQLDLDSLPTEIESNSFDDAIELSNLPDSVADDDIQQHLDACNGGNELTTTIVKNGKSTSSQYGDYFDEIKLVVGNVGPLSDNELPDQSIVETFGEYV